MPLLLLFFACQETTDYNAEIEDLRSQLYQHQVTIDELESRVNTLNVTNAELQDQIYRFDLN